jgi:hypothetical protein
MKRHIPGISNSCPGNVLDYPHFPPNYDVLFNTGTRVPRVRCDIRLTAARQQVGCLQSRTQRRHSVVGSNIRPRESRPASGSTRVRKRVCLSVIFTDLWK